MGEPPKVKTKKLYSLCKQDSGGIASLKKVGQTVSTETDKANTLNVQFQSAFSPKTPVSLKSLAQKSLQDLHDSSVELLFQPSPYPKMPDISVSAEGIDKLLLGLNPHKAAGPDKLKAIILQTLHEELSPILKLIVQKSLDGKLPDVWKEANVSPPFSRKGTKPTPLTIGPFL